MNGWIAKVLRSSQTHDLRDALSSAVTQQPDGTKDCDLDKLLHKSEFMFVKLVAAASLIREDLAKDIVLPTILKVLCRYSFCLGFFSFFLLYADVVTISENQTEPRSSFINSSSCF